MSNWSFQLLPNRFRREVPKAVSSNIQNQNPAHEIGV